MPALSVYKMYGKTILMVSFSRAKWKRLQQNKQSALSSQGNWAGISKESKKWPLCVPFVSAGSWEGWHSTARACETAHSLSYTLHELYPLLKCDCAAWSHEWALTLYKMIKLRVMLSKYQNAQVKQYAMLTMQNINKISNKINWILRFCVTVHCIIIQYITSVSIMHSPLSQNPYLFRVNFFAVLECKEFKGSELTKGSDIFWPQSLCT